MSSRDAAANMVIERDLQITMDDGLILRADVYRPKTDAPVPVIMTLGPYGKGVMYQDHYKAMWDWLIAQHPDLLPGSTRSFMAWETVDPETWVPWGYAVVRVNSRGACRSPGMLDIFSPRETLDYYHAIEWAGTRPWSNGKVGLNGISYYAINQWHVAQLQPPHLTAMVPWEGAADMYRDWYRHGGILSNKFMEVWYPRQVLQVQHGNPKAPRDHWMNESAAGPEQLSPEELAANRVDNLANARAREMDDEWYRNQSPDWSKVHVPFLSAANWAGFGLHPRGNFEAFTQAASKQKWLEGHPGRHEEWFYVPYGMALQKRFFDYFLKGEQNGWDKEPRVWVNLRRPFSKEFELRKEDAWPLEGTRWTKLFLDAAERQPRLARAGARRRCDIRGAEHGRHLDVAAARARDRDHWPDGAQALRVVVDRRCRPVRHRAGVLAGRPRSRLPGHDRSAHAAGAGLAARVASQARRGAVAALSALPHARRQAAPHSRTGLRARRGGLADVHRAAGRLPHCRKHRRPRLRAAGDGRSQAPVPGAWLGPVDAQ